MRGFLILLILSALSGCAAIQKTYEYEGLPLVQWSNPQDGHQYQVQDNALNSTMLFAPSSAESARDGAAFGLASRPEEEYYSAALVYLSTAKAGQCEITAFNLQFGRLYEVAYSCA